LLLRAIWFSPAPRWRFLRFHPEPEFGASLAAKRESPAAKFTNQRLRPGAQFDLSSDGYANNCYNLMVFPVFALVNSREQRYYLEASACAWVFVRI